MAWLASIPQEKLPPAVMAVKVPSGGSIWPSLLSYPQQAAVLSVLKPHTWELPASRAIKVPGGGVSMEPQQVTVLSALSPQEYAWPAVMAVKTSAGADASPW